MMPFIDSKLSKYDLGLRVSHESVEQPSREKKAHSDNIIFR